MRLTKRFAEGSSIAEVAGRKCDPLRGIPTQLLKQFEDDGFLPFQPPGVDGVEQINPEALARLADKREAGVEIAAHQQSAGAIGEGLGQLAEGDLSGGHKD